MYPGTKPKPTELKMLEGNLGHRPFNNNEPKPPKKMLECPQYIEEDVLAKQEWDRIIPELYLLNLLTTVDRAAIELYCTQYSIYRQALEDIKKNGLTTFNIRNGSKANPSVAIARESAKIIKAIATEFGLTPSSRSRIKIPNEEPEDEMEKLLTPLENC